MVFEHQTDSRSNAAETDVDSNAEILTSDTGDNTNLALTNIEDLITGESTETSLVDDTDLTNRSNSELIKTPMHVVPGDFGELILEDSSSVASTIRSLRNAAEMQFNNAVKMSDRVRRFKNGDGTDSGDDKITRDAEGRVTEVEYPNGKTRQFGYDEAGNLNRIVQPNGQTLLLENGEWIIEAPQKPPGGKIGSVLEGIFGSGRKGSAGAPSEGSNHIHTGTEVSEGEAGLAGVNGEALSGIISDRLNNRSADIKNPQVGPDGTFTFERQDGSKTTIYTDGNQMIETKDGAKIFADIDNNVTSIMYANGDTRTFTYDANGKISGIMENGEFYTVDDNKIYGPDGQPTGETNPFVGIDGTYTVTDSEGDFVSTYADGTSSEAKLDGSFVTRDAEGRIREIHSPNGTSREFGYDEDGNLNLITDQDGKRYQFDADIEIDFLNIRIGKFRAQDGTVLNDVSLAEDGTLTYEDQDGKLHKEFTSGNSTETSMTEGELRQKALQLHGSSWILTDNSSIKEALEGMSDADRVALDEQYKEMFGRSLSDRLRRQMWNPLKRDNIREALDDLTESHLRVGVQKAFSDPDLLDRANQAIDDFKERAREQGVNLDEMSEAQQKALEGLKNGGRSQADLLQELERNLTNVAPTLESLNTKYGVESEEITKPDGSTVRQYYVEGIDGEKIPVIESTSDNPEEIEQQLKEWQEAKMNELEQKYNVKISREGERDAPLRNVEVEMRNPNIKELLVLEDGLEHSEPSTHTENGKPILVQFPATPSSPYNAYVIGHTSGQQRIVFEPGQRSYEGMRNTVIHEWAHIGERNMSERNPEALDKWYEEMGFRKIQDESGKDQWQLRDEAGNYYAQGPDQAPFGKWTRVDENGRPLKADGSLADGWSDREADTISNNEMQQRADVRPPTTYFTNPGEMGAESMEFFRGGRESRSEFFNNDPDLYWSTKEFDQAEIDADPRFGTNPDGSSRYIRMPDGTLARNNEANQKTVADFEAQLKSDYEQRQREESRREQTPGQASDKPNGNQSGGESPANQHQPHPHTHPVGGH